MPVQNKKLLQLKILFPGPVILLENNTPYVIGISFRRHKCSLACGIPDLNIRVTTVLHWIKLNNLEGVCIPPNSLFSKLFQFLFFTNYVFFTLKGLLIYIDNKENWKHSIVFVGYMLTACLIFVENAVCENWLF